ncbi:hypothetical protein HanRHA438_Chr09g0380561 [Helianthus annuus]|nr:hypothetical protein HanIR_Chr09g0398051 [Helianthus annuus]KAJ0886538.1 hypothetical protein HanRHA438_Chr09g0380561 [Helianthus annuus]
MDFEDVFAYCYYESQQFYPQETKEKPVLKEKESEVVSEKAPVFDNSSDEESDND